MKENIDQVQKMLSLAGTKGIYYVTNYQYQLTVYGIQKWLNLHYQRFHDLNNAAKIFKCES